MNKIMENGEVTENQISNLELPLKFGNSLIYKPEHRSEVQQHWDITFSRRKRVSVLANRILVRIFDQIRQDESTLRPFYQLHLRDLAPPSIYLNNFYRQIEDAVKELTQMVWEIREVAPDGSYNWKIVQLVNTHVDGHDVGYASGTGILTIALSPKLEPFLIRLSHYSKFRVDPFLELHSWYAQRLYELLSAFRDTGEWYVTVDEYRTLVDCDYERDKTGRPKKDRNGNTVIKHPKVNDLIRSTIHVAQKELSKTDMDFEFEPIHESTNRKGRPPIIAFRFKLKSIQLNEIPEEWFSDERKARTIDSLRKWKVSDFNIARYMDVIGLDAINKEIYRWQLKDNSSDKITDRTKYCNGVIARMGKSALEKMREGLKESPSLFSPPKRSKKASGRVVDAKQGSLF